MRVRERECESVGVGVRRQDKLFIFDIMKYFWML